MRSCLYSATTPYEWYGMFADWDGKAHRSWDKYPMMPTPAADDARISMHTIKLIDKILFIAGGDKDTYTFPSGQLFKLLGYHELLQKNMLAGGPLVKIFQAGFVKHAGYIKSTL